MKMNFKSKFFYAGGDFGINIMWQLTVFYLLFFYTDVFGLSPAKAGSVFFIAKIWDGFTDPLMGYIADKTRTRWGKFRPYLLFASIPTLISIILCFYTPNLSEDGKFIWALSTYITFTTLYTVLSVPYGSLIPAMTQDIDERTSLSSYRYIAASCGAIVVASLTLPLVGIFTDQKAGFVFAVSFFAILALIFLILCFYNTKESFAKYNNEKYSLKKIFRMLIENKPFQLILIAISTTWIANNMKTATVVYFVKYNLNLEQFFGPIVLGAILQIILGAWITNLIKNKLEKKDIFIIGTLLYVISDLIIFYLIGYNNFWTLVFFASFGFIGFGMAGVMVWSMLSDAVEYGEWKSDIRAEGILNSFFNFFFKFGVGLSGWLAGQILEKNDYIPQAINQDQGVLLGLFQIGYLYPAISGTIAIIFMLNFKYSKEFYSNIIKEINLR